MVQSNRIPLSVQLNLFFLSESPRGPAFSFNKEPEHWVTVADIIQL